MAEKLQFSLVSPERELFSGEVDQVDVPGTEGDFGVLANHAPFMAAIRTGAITVHNDNENTQYMIRGGFADVTPDGLTILAEQAKPIGEVTSDFLQHEIEEAKIALEAAEGDAKEEAAQHLAGLETLRGH